MRIAAHNGARIWGGAERATVMLLRGLEDRGHEVRLFCNDEIVRKEAEARGVHADVLPIGGDLALAHAVSLSRALRRYEPAAFIIGTWKKVFLASLGARLANVPRVVARIGLETDTPRSVKYRFALRRWVDAVAVNAERMIEPFASLEGFGSQKVTLIHNGVRKPVAIHSRQAVRSQLRIPDDAFVVGAVARLARQKRLDRLLEAVSLSDTSVHALIAGDGEERATLTRETARRQLTGRVHFIGHREDPGSVLAALDAFVISSDREGLSNSMLEAMSFGLPLISTRVSGSADAIEGDDPSGIIVGFHAAEIAAAIERLRKHPALREEMGNAARQRADTTFSFDGMLDRWEAFLSA